MRFGKNSQEENRIIPNTSAKEVFELFGTKIEYGNSEIVIIPLSAKNKRVQAEDN